MLQRLRLLIPDPNAEPKFGEDFRTRKCVSLASGETAPRVPWKPPSRMSPHSGYPDAEGHPEELHDQEQFPALFALTSEDYPKTRLLFF